MKRRNRADRRKASKQQRERDATIKAVSEFYMEVAHSLDLPPKALPVAPPPPPRQTREEVLRAIRAKPAFLTQRAWWLPAIAVLLLAGMGAYYWWPATKAAVPEGFRGTWVSQNPSYAGRMMVISMETIEIVSGRSAATGPVAVTSSTVDTVAEGIRMRLVYGAGNRAQSLEMTLHQGPPATVTLLRPAHVVWERREGAPTSPAANAAASNP